MRAIVFFGKTYAGYEDLRAKDKKLHAKLCKILQEMQRSDPASGIGIPEPLKHKYSGCWSRRLSKRDRVIYRYDDNNIYVLAIGGHYDQK